MSRPVKGPPRRWSRSLFTVTQRSRRSWTRWLQRRKERQLAREKRRLLVQEQLLAYQAARVHLAEQRLYPLLAVAPLLKEEPELPLAQVHHLTPGRPEPQREQMLTLEELEARRPPEQPEQPMPDPALEIARRLGLEPPPS